MAVRSVSNLAEAKALVHEAMAGDLRLEVLAGASKRLLGRACAPDLVMDVTPMAGIVDYQPEELVLTLRAGTPMDAVQAALDGANQMLAFEPPDSSRLFAGAGVGTIGGVIATNLSGPRRLTAGAARDYLLGFEAVSGRGEHFKSGGRVMKNVTGYDLSKLMTGSFGTLAVMDEITLKTLPRPETGASLLIPADSFAAAVRQIAALFATPHEPGAAAILPIGLAKRAGLGVTDQSGACICVIRLEGIEISVADRLANLRALAGGETLAQPQSEVLWRQIRDVSLLDDQQHDLWKISCAPADAPAVVQAVAARHDIAYFADWAGGLIWLTGQSPGLGADLRQIIAERPSGFAMLVRDANGTGRTMPPLHPLTGSLAGLHHRVKAAFDPRGVLNFGRMHDGI